VLYFIHDFINNTCNNQIKLPCNRDVNNNNKYCIMIMLYLILHAMTTCNTTCICTAHGTAADDVII